MQESILLIDDNEEIRENTKYLLELKGYKVITASDGKKGLEIAFLERPNLILCDIKMPSMNGYEVIKILKKNEETLTIPFIFISVRSELTDIRLGMQLGADDYIVKPFLAKDLIDSVRVRLDKYNAIKMNTPLINNLQNNNRLSYNKRIILKGNNTLLFSNVNEITHIIAENQYTKVFFKNSKNIVVYKSLKEWESILPDNEFIRIHRSYVININYVEKIEKYSKSAFSIKLENINNIFISSRRFSAKIRANIN